MRSTHRWLASLMLFALVTLTLPAFISLAQEQRDLPGFYVEGRHLYDFQGNKVILYGINKMVIYTDRDGLPSFEEIAKTGANVVRIVWLTEGSADELDVAITNAYNNDLIPMIDCHDSTGKWGELETCVDYWVRPDVLKVLLKHERYLLLNVANEAGKDILPEAQYRAAYTTAIYRMRDAGIHVPLIIDAQGWGQSINDLQLNGPYLMDIDPDHNLMFSVHLWWPSAWRGANVDQQVIDEIEESVAMDLPLIIGEFASMGPGCACCIPYQTIIEQCHKHEIGYLPWSWGPGNGDCETMDMTEDGTFETLHDWGLEVAITSTHSIANIAVRPDWIVNDAPLPTSTPAPTPTPLPAPEGLLSIGAAVTASSQEKDELPAANAVDGRVNTRWSSVYEDNQELVLDLGSVQPIGKIMLLWETAYGKEYKLHVSDEGDNWTEIVHETSSNGDRDTHEVDAQGRFVRLEGIQRATEWGFSIYEFWVFSDASAPEPEFTDAQEVTAEVDNRPDLVVRDITWQPERAMKGQPITLQAVVTNEGIGATDSNDGWQVTFTINGEDVAISEPVDKALAGTMDMTVSAETLWTPDTEGDFIFTAHVDSSKTVDEADERNNFFSEVARIYAGTAVPTNTPRPTRTPEPAPTEIKDDTANVPSTPQTEVLLPEPELQLPFTMFLAPLIALVVLGMIVWLARKPKN